MGYFLPRVCVRACVFGERSYIRHSPGRSIVSCSRLCEHERTHARTRTRAHAHRQLGFSKATSANSCNDQFSPLGCTSRRDFPPPVPCPRSPFDHPTDPQPPPRRCPFEPLTSFPFFYNDVCFLSIATNPATHNPPRPANPGIV